MVASNTLLIDPSRVIHSSTLGDIQVEYSDQKFFIAFRGKQVLVQHHDLSKPLRGICPEALEKCLAVGSLHISKRGEDFAIEWKGRLLGGGPIAGMIGYWGTKAVCYGTAIAGGTAAVVGTGGAVAGPVGAAATAAAAEAAIASAGATVGTGAVAAGVLSSAAASAAAGEATVAVVTGAGGISGAIAFVESASTTVGAVLTACPFLP